MVGRKSKDCHEPIKCFIVTKRPESLVGRKRRGCFRMPQVVELERGYKNVRSMWVMRPWWTISEEDQLNRGARTPSIHAFYQCPQRILFLTRDWMSENNVNIVGFCFSASVSTKSLSTSPHRTLINTPS